MKKLLFYTLLLFGIYSANAQSEMTQLLKTGKEDAYLLIKDYATPFLETFGSNLNNGWYSTAAPLKTARFAITIGGTLSIAPSDKQTFTIDPNKYQHVKTDGNIPLSAPTIFGSADTLKGLYATYTNSNGTVNTPINLMGTGIKYSPLPVIQLSVGLVKGTEVMLRVFPKIKIDKNKIGYFGLGIKHDIKQWIPGMKDKPFDLSFIGAFTSASVDVVGNNLLSADVGVYNPSPVDYSNQIIKFNSTAWNVNIVISKKLSLLTVFGGVRLSHYKSTLDLTGNFPISVVNNAGNKEIQNIVDPIVGMEGSGTKFGLNGGLRLKLGLFALFAEGSMVPGGYNSVTGGLNIGLFN